MSRLGGFSPREVQRAAERDGWRVVRQRGSHIVMRKPGYVQDVIIPAHGEVPRGTLRQIIRAMEVTVAEFLRLVRD